MARHSRHVAGEDADGIAALQRFEHGLDVGQRGAELVGQRRRDRSSR